MIPAGLRSDRGATVPLYAMVMAGMLFVAFALFAVAKAATVRNGAQSAADAAALAAAQDARDKLTDGFLGALDGDWADWLGGDEWRSETACDAAADFAARNRADLVSCEEADGRRGYTVKVRTRYTVGDTLIPGTENKRATATATAVIEPRCHFDVGNGGGDLVEFTCDGRDWSLDLGDLDILPEARDLFAVYLDD